MFWIRSYMRYVPDYYHSDLQKHFCKLSHGTRSIDEYFEEFEKMNQLELEESEEALIVSKNV